MLPVNMVQLAPAGDNRNYAIWFAKHILKAIQIYKLFFFFFKVESGTWTEWWGSISDICKLIIRIACSY